MSTNPSLPSFNKLAPLAPFGRTCQRRTAWADSLFQLGIWGKMCQQLCVQTLSSDMSKVARWQHVILAKKAGSPVKNTCHLSTWLSLSLSLANCRWGGYCGFARVFQNVKEVTLRLSIQAFCTCEADIIDTGMGMSMHSRLLERTSTRSRLGYEALTNWKHSESQKGA